MAKSPDPLSGLKPSWKRRAREGREVWRKFKKFGDSLGDAILDGADFGEAASKFIRRNSRRYLIPAALGCLSPLTGGLWIQGLTGSTLAMWAPVGILPAVVALFLFIRWCFSYIDDEAEREAERGQRERRQPWIMTRLAQGDTERVEANRSIRADHKLPPLERVGLAADLLSETLDRIRARQGNQDVCLALVRRRKKRGYVGVLQKGGMDDRVEAALNLGPVEPEAVPDLLEGRLRPLQHRHFYLPFHAGVRKYLLVATAGATISDDVMVEVDKAATSLVREYARELGDSGSIEERQ